ncbi:MAG: DUF1822 family protein [Cyanobacteria bacterium P01_F01_bin.150]
MTKPLSNLFSIQQPPTIPVLLPSESVQLARQLAQDYSTSPYIEQTYHNLLAVLAVNHYLKMLEFQTDLSQSDCWNPFLRMTTNVTDLEVVGYGRLECCPVSVPVAEDGTFDIPQHCIVPAEVQENRVGYIAVQVDGDIAQGQPKVHLLGFTDQIKGEEWLLSERRSLFELPQSLEQLKPTRLSNWLKEMVESPWSALDAVLSPQVCRSLQLQPRSRSTVTPLSAIQAKPLTLSTQAITLDTTDLPETAQNESFVLVAEVIDKPGDHLDVELKICPVEGATFLPPGLEMTILDTSGETVMHVQARADNKMMNLGFYADLGDRFQLQVRLDDDVLVESFVV